MSKVTKDKKQPLVRIDSADKAVLDQLAAQTGESTPRLLHRAVTQLKRQIFFERMNGAYQHIRTDNQQWAVETEERALFDKSSADGLNKDQLADRLEM